jgi:hypothetical protein
VLGYVRLAQQLCVLLLQLLDKIGRLLGLSLFLGQRLAVLLRRNANVRKPLQRKGRFLGTTSVHTAVVGEKKTLQIFRTVKLSLFRK